MAVEFGQEKSGGALEVSEEAGICGSRSTSVCLLPALAPDHAPPRARKSATRFSPGPAGPSGDAHTHAHAHTHSFCHDPLRPSAHTFPPTHIHSHHTYRLLK